jgi:hypothetical protein
MKKAGWVFLFLAAGAALPAGVDTVQAGITAASSSANLDIRFDWSNQ